MTLKLAYYVLITSMGIVAWKCALKHSFPSVHGRAKVRRNVLIGASHLLVLTAEWGATSRWCSLACSSSPFLCCLIFPTSLNTLYSFYKLCSVPFPVLFYPNASLLVRTHFFSASLCPFTCFPFSRVFHASWLSQSTFSLPPGVTVLQIRAARSSSCSREQAEQREMELMSCEHVSVVKAFLLQFAHAQVLFVEETKKRFNPQGG